MSCVDCGRAYGDEHGFPDLIIPYSAWKEISPTGDDGGLLCPSCICKRLHDKGIRCEGAFMSGPIISVSSPTMYALRRVENIELAIEGRENRWNGIRELMGTTQETGTARRCRCGQVEWEDGARRISCGDGSDHYVDLDCVSAANR